MMFIYIFHIGSFIIFLKESRSHKVIFLLQRTVSSSSLASSNGNPAEVKMETSLIDFDAAPEPPAPAALPQAQQSTVAQVAPSGGDNWANFDSMSEVKGSKAPTNANPLESVLSELSMAAPAPGHLTTASTGNTSAFPGPASGVSFGLPFGSVAPPAAAVSSSVPFPSGAPASTAGLNHLQPIPGGNSFGQWSQSQPQSLFPGMGGQSLAQPSLSATAGPSSNQV